MRFTVTGEWDHNRLLQVVVVLYCFFVILLWLTNWTLYFDSMDLTTASVVNHYLGNEEEFRAPRTYRGMVELAHFHLFAMGMLMMVLTHLALFVPLRPHWKIALIVVPFFSALASVLPLAQDAADPPLFAEASISISPPPFPASSPSSMASGTMVEYLENEDPDAMTSRARGTRAGM